MAARACTSRQSLQHPRLSFVRQLPGLQQRQSMSSRERTEDCFPSSKCVSGVPAVRPTEYLLWQRLKRRGHVSLPSETRIPTMPSAPCICALDAVCMNAPADALLCCPLCIACLMLRGVDRPLGVLGSPSIVVYVAHGARNVLVDPAHALPFPVVRQQLNHHCTCIYNRAAAPHSHALLTYQAPRLAL